MTFGATMQAYVHIRLEYCSQ